MKTTERKKNEIMIYKIYQVPSPNKVNQVYYRWWASCHLIIIFRP